jgi:predicted ferric reductase
MSLTDRRPRVPGSPRPARDDAASGAGRAGAARASQRTRRLPGSPRSRSARRPVIDGAVALGAIGLGVVVGLGVIDETAAGLRSAGGPATFVGSLTGLVGTYLALLMLVLVARLPWLESALGQDGLLRWHRRLGPWPISLLCLHAVAITIGYAQAAHTGIAHELRSLITGFPDVLAATVGLGLMVMAGVVSIRAVRRRVRRETWWAVHLYLYLALALSFAHVLALGPSFVGHPLTRAVWAVIWAATAGCVLVWRVGLPVVRSLRHRLRVVEVQPEAPGVVSILCEGRHLERLPVAGGQFFQWRFLARGLWWQAHPYSVSALPQPPYLRLTVKVVGDHSAALARIPPGTGVAIEGPYGVFTAASARRTRAVLVAAGIGVTALRSLLEDLPERAAPVVILRAARREELALRDEIAQLVELLGGELHELYGSRRDQRVDGRLLRRLVPDVTRRDLYVCGPEAFVAGVAAAAAHLGLPADAIHHEAFAL